LEEIWVLSDICNGLMAFPNLVALVLLSGVVASETKAYMQHLEENKK
jgi:AGCS family alanine or glycine:cation symporter